MNSDSEDGTGARGRNDATREHSGNFTAAGRRAASASLEAALDYLGRPWSPIPVPDGAKGPVHKGWQELRLTPETAGRYFNGGLAGPLNIGILTGEPSGGLIDADLDCPEAVRLAPSYLPPTRSVFGRAGKPRSHREYTAPGIRREQYKDPESKELLLELRGTGCQTIFPPSRHPSGETVAWAEDGDPAPCDAGELKAAAGRLAAAVMLVRAAPREEGRHDFLWLVANALTRALGPEPTKRFLAPVAREVLPDREEKAAAEVARLVERAVALLAEGAPVTGWPRLVEEIGPKRADALAGWLDVRRDHEPAEGDTRPTLQLVVGSWNRTIDRCAGLLRNVVFMRGIVAVMLARAEDVAGGRRCEDRDGPAIDVHGVRYRPGELLFVEATAGRAWWLLNERARFQRHVRRENAWVDTLCPKEDLAGAIVENAVYLDFHQSAGIVHTPLLLPGGELVTASGYHAATKLVLDVRTGPLAVPETPTKADALAGLEALLRPFRGYVGRGTVGRPVAAAAALTAAMKASLGAAPAIMLDGNAPGVGKGKFARALAMLGTGGLPAIVTEGHNDEELEKRIAAAVIQGSAAILLDNLQRRLASSTLESMQTEPVADIRAFGKLASLRVPCRALVLVTANNASVRADMLRRSLPVRIAVPDEDPELRAFDFDPVEEVARDLATLLAAAFTIIRAWRRVRDLPENKDHRKALGSFEAWADDVAGAVSWLTGTNPVDLIEERKHADPKFADERAVIAALAAWQAGLRDDKGKKRAWWRAKEAATGIAAELWAPFFPKARGEAPAALAVGAWLRSRKDRVFGGLRLSGLPDRDGIAEWTIEPFEPAGPKPESAGDAGDAGGNSHARDQNGVATEQVGRFCDNEADCQIRSGGRKYTPQPPHPPQTGGLFPDAPEPPAAKPKRHRGDPRKAWPSPRDLAAWRAKLGDTLPSGQAAAARAWCCALGGHLDHDDPELVRMPELPADEVRVAPKKEAGRG